MGGRHTGQSYTTDDGAETAEGSCASVEGGPDIVAASVLARQETGAVLRLVGGPPRLPPLALRGHARAAGESEHVNSARARPPGQRTSSTT